MAETEDLKSFQCRFESDPGHQINAQIAAAEQKSTLESP